MLLKYSGKILDSVRNKEEMLCWCLEETFIFTKLSAFFAEVKFGMSLVEMNENFCIRLNFDMYK